MISTISITCMHPNKKKNQNEVTDRKKCNLIRGKMQTTMKNHMYLFRFCVWFELCLCYLKNSISPHFDRIIQLNSIKKATFGCGCDCLIISTLEFNLDKLQRFRLIKKNELRLLSLPFRLSEVH